MVWLAVGLTVNLNAWSVKQCVEIYTETKSRTQAFHWCKNKLKSDIKSPENSGLKTAKCALFCIRERFYSKLRETTLVFFQLIYPVIYVVHIETVNGCIVLRYLILHSYVGSDALQYWILIFSLKWSRVRALFNVFSPCDILHSAW
jgi:hypothetical protein